MAHEFIQHLEKDHEEQRRLGEQLRQAEAPERRKQLRQQFHEALYPHMLGEEASIFDYMQSSGGEAGKEARKAVQEHHVAKVVLRELMDLNADGEVFMAKAYVLDELNRHHMDEEENKHFPLLERMADKNRLDALYTSYEQAEKQAKQ